MIKAMPICEICKSFKFIARTYRAQPFGKSKLAIPEYACSKCEPEKIKSYQQAVSECN